MSKKGKVIIFISIVIMLIFLFYIIYCLGNNKLKISSYNNPIVPIGFKRVETETASWELENGIPKGWNDGLVIEDEIGNQFVWIPLKVDQLNQYTTYDNKIIYNKEHLNKEKKDERQILKYGGFYVARYEAGLPDKIANNKQEFSNITNNIEGIPVSKKNSIPWNNISFENAKKCSSLMYDTSDINSSIITEKQFLYIISWLSKDGYSITSSKNWGNYANSYFSYSGLYSENFGLSYSYVAKGIKQDKNILLATGISEHNKAKNIYDLAGNLMEYVNNTSTNKYSIYGGYFDYIDQGAYQILNYYNSASPYIGYRVVLNIN